MDSTDGRRVYDTLEQAEEFLKQHEIANYVKFIVKHYTGSFNQNGECALILEVGSSMSVITGKFHDLATCLVDEAPYTFPVYQSCYQLLSILYLVYTIIAEIVYHFTVMVNSYSK